MTETTNCNGNHILVGLGGTGGKILKAFKMRMFEEFPVAEVRDKLPVARSTLTLREMMSKDGKAARLPCHGTGRFIHQQRVP